MEIVTALDSQVTADVPAGTTTLTSLQTFCQAFELHRAIVA
jgi:hypothetical protein